MTADVADDGKIVCKIDNARVHSIPKHLKDHHPEWTLERYQETYKDEPILSQRAIDAIKERRKKLAADNSVTQGFIRKPMFEVFGLPPAKCQSQSRGTPIMISVVDPATLDETSSQFIPEIDPNYVWDIDLLRIALLAMELNEPGYFWGYHGSGKTTCWEQVCARTGRPWMRVQHTINTEETHILGQWGVRATVFTAKAPDGAGGVVDVETIANETVFNLGPLPLAMLNGWVYGADEYDFALPSVTSVYQPVLEGKPLIIKEAPAELRVIRPHTNFRFVATGNTNGSGDETGLYQGTQIQNAANFSRFSITRQVHYPPEKVEQAIVSGQSGARMEPVSKLVKIAGEVRKLFASGQISSTLSPRELIKAAKFGVARGDDWRGGLELAFLNRLSRTDAETVGQFAQRVFGGTA